MGALNEDPKFVAVMMKLQMEWYTLAKELSIKNYCSWCVIVWYQSQASPRLFHNSPGCSLTPTGYTKTEKVQVVS